MGKLSILTSHVGQTQGDVSAALKLITYITKKNDDRIHIQINWILIFKENFSNMELYSSYIKHAQELGINVVTVFKTIEAWEEIKRLNTLTDLYIIFPATPFQLKSIIWLDSFNKPICIVSEYDYDEILIPTVSLEHTTAEKILPRISPNITVLKSGLGLNHLGIFSELPQKQEPQSLNNIDKPTDLILLKYLNIIDQKTLQLDFNLLNNYLQKTKVYFAYFNQSEDQQVINSTSTNPINFYKICLLLAMQDSSTNVDFVINHNPNKNDLKFKPLADKFSKIEIINRDGQITTAIKLNPNIDLPKIRFFNPFPMGFSTYKLFLQISESFSGLTGDQSLTEGVIEGKLIFYQIMAWKKNFAAEFLNICNTCLGAESLLCTFYSMIMTSSTPKQPGCTASLGLFWRSSFDQVFFANFIALHEKELLAQMQTLNIYIYEHHNLAANLYHKLEELLYRQENTIIDPLDQQNSWNQLRMY